MDRRTFLAATAASVAPLAGCATQTAVHSEVKAQARVVGVERYDGAIEATIEVVNQTAESGTVGLHVHYWKGDRVHHTHVPTTYVQSGEKKTITDTFDHDPDPITKVTAHVHE